MRTIGVIGGSGLYQMEGLTHVENVRLETPFGAPSDDFIVGELAGSRVAFLPRHGRGHGVAPHEINYRANIHGMKQLGAEWILSVSAVGSMRENIRPGDVVVIDQFFDRTSKRVNTFFGDGLVGHIPFADPICPHLASHLEAAARLVCRECPAEHRPTVHPQGTYLVIDGPQFSTRAESRIYRQWDIDVIGMTNLPEAKLAREAEICYATLALSTDYDCWHETEEDVSVESVLAVLAANVSLAKAIVKQTIESLPAERACICAHAAAGVLIGGAKGVSPAARQRYQLLFGKYLEE